MMMAVCATVSPVNTLITRTPFLPSLNPSFHHPNTHSSLIIIPQAKFCVKASKGEQGFGGIDEYFFFNNGVVEEEEDDEDEDEEEEEEEEDEDENAESSIDLLFRFLHSMFKKVSKRVRKASRSVLPTVIPPQLVSFGVDGVLILAFLSILKAFLEVACTIGGTVFVVILLLRVISAAIFYFQSSQNDFNRSGTSYGRIRPLT